MSATDMLTEVVLRRLYLDEHLTETEIAARYSTYQVQVNRLRKKWGIGTMARAGRLDVPASLPDRLRSILVGSMLGDGSIQRIARNTARYAEHHCEKQSAYLDWKVAEWGSFVSSVTPSDKGEHKGRRIITHACPTLFPYWEMFYPEGSGDKTFGRLDLDGVDALALAVWFMDDGSRTESFVRFSVGPGDADNRVRLRILRRFGLNPAIYGEPGDQGIHVQNRSDLTRFIDAVAPHMPECMTYKLDFKRPRALGPAPRDILREEVLRAHTALGRGSGLIARALGVSVGSVRRAMDRNGIDRPGPGRPPGAAQALTWKTAETYIRSLDSAHPDIVDMVTRAVLPLPLPEPPTPSEALRDFDALRNRGGAVVAGETVNGSRLGLETCLPYFQYRYDSRYRNLPSIRVAWADPQWVHRAIRLQIKLGDPLLPMNVFRAVRVLVRCPSNFRPSVAMGLINALSPLGGLVLDPCAGYGGRAVGAAASGRAYLGVDPHPEAAKAFSSLFKDLGSDGRIIQAPFEDVSLGDIQADMAITSPPYFRIERYSDDPTQSWVRFSTWESWVAGFMHPLIRKTFDHLKPGGYFCLNLSDMRDGRRTYSLVETSLRLAAGMGFEHVRTLPMVLGRFGKVAKTEPILILRRPPV